MSDRKKKGKNISGWILIDKPRGISSSAVVNKIKWCLNAKKAGHAGTLDPEATGLLVVALGEATKTISFITEAFKSYDFTINLGSQTTTDDLEGEIIKSSTNRPNKKNIQEALIKFQGEISQVPPQFSAVKINGERAYKQARKGNHLKLKPRLLKIEYLKLVEIHDSHSVSLKLRCGKGGYVRSIARDLGIELGCFAHVRTLKRIASGPFKIENAITFDIFKNKGQDRCLEEWVLPLEYGLKELNKIEIDYLSVKKLKQGLPIERQKSDAPKEANAWASFNNKAIAIINCRDGILHPSKVFLNNDY